MFNCGDTVKIKDDFDGDIILHGWEEPTIEDYVFNVATFEEYQAAHPEFSKVIKKGPSKHGEVFLRWKKKVFVLSPPRALERIATAPVCDCPINQLWAGNGHRASCPEFPSS